MNRKQRRHPEKAGPETRARPRQDLGPGESRVEEPDARTKSSGHGKKTADKWNQ